MGADANDGIPSPAFAETTARTSTVTQRRLSVTVAAGLIIVGGCTLIPRYERPSSPVASVYPGREGASGAGGPGGWPDFVTDERLKAILGLALENNRDLRVAVLRVEQSRAQYGITRSASLPSVDASASLTHASRSNATTDQWSATVATSSYELDLFGRGPDPI